MKKVAKTSVASAVFGCVAGLNSASNAQQLTPPEQIDRTIISFDDLQSSKAASQGKASNKYALTPQDMAIAKSIANSQGSITSGDRKSTTAMAGTVNVAGIVKRPAAMRVTPDVKDYCEQPTKISSQGTVTKSTSNVSKRTIEAASDSMPTIKRGMVGIHSQSK